MIAIGIDPGSVNVGFAMIRSGKVNSRYTNYWKSTRRLPLRYLDMREHLERALLALPEYPSVVAVELPVKPYGLWKQNRQRDIQILYGSFAVIVAEVGRVFKDTLLLPVQYDVWTGGLAKQEIQMRLAKKYKMKSFGNDDCADALGIADYAFEILRNAEEKKKEEDQARTAGSAAPGPGASLRSGTIEERSGTLHLSSGESSQLHGDHPAEPDVA